MKTCNVKKVDPQFGLRRSDFIRSAAMLFTAAPAVTLLSMRAASALPAKNELSILRGMPPRMVQAWSGGVWPANDGAAPGNQNGYLTIGFQYVTFNIISACLVNNDVRRLDAAIRVAEYAFAHQHSDGSFEYTDPETKGAPKNPESPVGNVAFFLYDFGHSLMVLASSPWYTTSAECAPYRKRIEALRPKVKRSLDWMLTQRALLATDRAASNRTLAQGLAFYLTGRAMNNSAAVAAGRQTIETALGAVDADGAFPEAGGFDSSYQGINLLECEYLYFYADPADGELSDRLWSTIKKGYQRESTSVQAGGNISTAGNSRVGGERNEAFMGHRKSVNWKQVAMAMAYYAGMADDSNARTLCQSILTAYYKA